MEQVKKMIINRFNFMEPKTFFRSKSVDLFLVICAMFAGVSSNMVIAQCDCQITVSQGGNVNFNATDTLACVPAGVTSINGVSGTGTLCIADGAVLTINGLSPTVNISNYGDLTLGLNTGSGQKIDNYGTMVINQVNFNGAAAISNFVGGHMTIDVNSFNLGNGSSIYNEDTLVMPNGFATGGNTLVENRGWIYVSGNHFNPNGKVLNYGWLSSDQFLNINSQAEIVNYCWFIGQSFNLTTTTEPFVNYGGIWVDDASASWNNGSTVQLGPQSIIYSKGGFTNDGNIVLLDPLESGANFYVEQNSLNQGIFGNSGDVINFYDQGSGTFDSPNGTIAATTTYNLIEEPDTAAGYASRISTCDGRIFGVIPPDLDLDIDGSSFNGTGTAADTANYKGEFTEGGTPVKINDTDFVIKDTERGRIDSMVVTIQNVTEGLLEDLLISINADSTVTGTTTQIGDSIKAVVLDDGHTISFSGLASTDAYEIVLDLITYINTSEDPVAGVKVVHVTVYNESNLFGEADALITIIPVNDLTIPVNDSLVVNEGGTQSILINGPGSLTVLDNDTDVDNTQAELTANVVTEPSHGTLTLNADGTFIYVHNGNEETTDQFTYKAFDGTDSSTLATVFIRIVPINDAPVAVNDTIWVNEGATQTILFTESASPNRTSVLSNDTDVDNPLSALSATQKSDVTNGDLTIFNESVGGGTFSYTHDGSETTSDVFTYKLYDGTDSSNIATVVIIIIPVNDDPVALNDTNYISEGTISVDQTNVLSTGNILVNDSDVDLGQVLSVGDVKGETDLSVIGTYGVLVWTTTGDYTYTLTPTAVDTLALGEEVVDEFIYTTTDSNGGEVTATLYVIITGINDDPIAVNDSNVTKEGDNPITDQGAASTGTLIQNDSDVDGDGLTITSIDGNTSATIQGTYGVLVWAADGSYTYTQDFSALDSLALDEEVIEDFSYIVNDGTSTASADLIITIIGTNDNPIAINDSNIMSQSTDIVEKTTRLSGLLVNDSDVDGDVLSVVEVESSTSTTTIGTYGTLTWDSDGVYSYNLNNTNATVVGLGEGESLVETFTYRITDGNNAFATADLIVTIVGGNASPIANPDVNSINEDDVSVSDNSTNSSGTLLFNDSDANVNDDLVVSQLGGGTIKTVVGTYGTLVWDNDGTYTYTLDNTNVTVQELSVSQSLIEVFPYSISDGETGTANSTLTITINGTNDLPVANPDVNAITEGTFSVLHTLGSGTLLDDDSDLDGDAFTVSTINASANDTIITDYGTLVWLSNGTYEYVLNPVSTDTLTEGETVLDVFTYVISDGNSGTASSTLTITITGVNDVPVLIDDLNAISEGDGPVTDASVSSSGTLLQNDTDSDLDVLTVTTINASGLSSVTGIYGVIVWGADGTYTYTLDNNAVDSLALGEEVIETFVYQATDGLATVAANLVITITGVNDAPIAVNDEVSITEGEVSVGQSTPATGILSNDSDVDGDGLLVSSINPTLNGIYGTIVWNENGTYTYTLNNASVDTLVQGEMTTDIFTYTASDSKGGTVDAILTVTINGINDVPVAINDSNSVLEGGTPITDASINSTGDLLVNDTDIDEEGLIVTRIVSGSTSNTDGTIIGVYGTLEWNDDGTYTYTLDNLAVDSLELDEEVIELFTYDVTDGFATVSADLVITIIGTNDAPVALNDTNTITEGQSSVGQSTPQTGVLSNDSDVDGDALIVESVSPSLNGVYGTLVWNTDGTYTYNLINASVDTLVQGEMTIDVFTYTASDSKGGTVDATLTITIIGVNDVPVAINDSNAILEGGTPITDATINSSGTLIVNDTDGDNEVLSITSISGDNLGSVTGTYGTLVWNSDGTYTYTLDNAAVDSLQLDEEVIETFSYVVTDGNTPQTANLIITITGTNDAPLAIDDVNSITEGESSVGQSTPQTGVLSNDSDVDGDGLIVESVSPTLNGVYGTLVWNVDGTYTYNLINASVDTLVQGETTTDVFTYTASDSKGGTVDATLTITIVGVNDVSVAVNDSNTILEGGNPVTDATSNSSGTLIVNDTDGDNEVLTVTSISGDNLGSVVGTYGTLEWNSDGTYTYTLDNTTVDSLQLGEEVIETFSYIVTDGNTPVTADLIITVTGTNDEPIAINDGNNMSESVDFVTDDQGSGTLLINDSDVDDNDVLFVSQVSNSVSNTTVGTYGELTWAADGTYSYDLNNTMPAVLGLGEGFILVDSFLYELSDGQGGLDEAYLIITVTGGNSVPNANPDINEIFEDQTSVSDVDGSGTMLNNDTDLDATDILTITSVNNSISTTSAGSYGELVWTEFNGSYIYTLDNSLVVIQELGVGEFVRDTFDYETADGNGGIANSTLIITIQGVNDLPVANPDVNSMLEGDISIIHTDGSGTLLQNDTDVDKNDQLSVSQVSTMVNDTVVGIYGTIVWLSNGSYIYIQNQISTDTLAEGEVVTDVFSYEISDGETGFDNSILTISITGVNDNPIANPDAITITEDTLLPIVGDTLLVNDEDSDATDVLIVATVNGQDTTVVESDFGTLTWDSTGANVYNLDTMTVQFLAVNESITDTFEYVISDGNGGIDTSILVITINGVNDTPNANPDFNSITRGDVSVGQPDRISGILSNDTDVDVSDELNVSTIDSTITYDGTEGAYGALVWGIDGSYTYTLDNSNPSVLGLALGEELIEVFVYSIDDGNGGTAGSSLTITINGDNSDPVANPDSVLISEDDIPVAQVHLLLTNDEDSNESDVLFVSEIVGSTDTTAIGEYGILSWDSSGTVIYTLDNDSMYVQALYEGEVVTDTFVYIVNDGNNGTDTSFVVVHILGVNDEPIAINDFNTILEGEVFVIETDGSGNVLDNDSDIDDVDVLTVQSFEDVESLIGEFDGLYGTLSWSSDGTYTYTLDNENTQVSSLAIDKSLLDEFQYVAIDSKGGDSSATLIITITGVNDNPVAFPDTIIITENDTIPTIGDTVLVNDVDPDGDTLIIVSVNDQDTNVVITDIGIVTWDSTGVIIYEVTNPDVDTLAVGEELVDTLVYVVSDSTGVTDTTYVLIVITGVNDAPVLVDDENSLSVSDISVSEPLETGVLSNDTDVDLSDVLTVTDFEIIGQFGELVWGVSGNYTYTIDQTNASVISLGSGQALTDTFFYQAEDNNGAGGTAKLVITITGSNDSPTANPDNVSIHEDSSFISHTDGNGTLISNDTDPDSGDTYSVVSVEGETSDSIVGVYGMLIWNEDGTYTYELENDLQDVQSLNDGESITETFDYTIEDEGGENATSFLTVRIFGENDSPIILDSFPTTDTTIVYEPNDTFPAIVVTDTVPAVTIYSEDSSQVLYVVDTIPENTLSIIDLEVTDPDDEFHTWEITEFPIRGTVTIDDSTGLLVFAPEEEDTGDFVIEVRVCDIKTCDTVNVWINVFNVNTPPVAVDDIGYEIQFQGDTTIDVIRLDVLGQDHDPEGDEDVDVTSIEIVSEPANGTVIVNSDGTVTYEANELFEGDDSFEYVFYDFSGAVSNIATVTIHVNNKPPFVINQVVSSGTDDGKNDYLHIDNIQYYPETNVEIFNRWGNLVWELPSSCNGYENEEDSECSFSGSSNVGLGSGGEVSDGSYFIVVDGTDEVDSDGNSNPVQPCQTYFIKN